MRRRGASKRTAESAQRKAQNRGAESAQRKAQNRGVLEACYGFEQKGNAQHEQSDLFFVFRCALCAQAAVPGNLSPISLLLGGTTGGQEYDATYADNSPSTPP